MPQILRRSFSIRSHAGYEHRYHAPLVPPTGHSTRLATLLMELKPYLDKLKTETLQPREAAVQALLQHI